jgi:hypothetical protein
MVCEGIRVSFYKHEYMVLRLVDQVKGRLRVIYKKAGFVKTKISS